MKNIKIHLKNQRFKICLKENSASQWVLQNVEIHPKACRKYRKKRKAEVEATQNKCELIYSIIFNVVTGFILSNSEFFPLSTIFVQVDVQAKIAHSLSLSGIYKVDSNQSPVP